MASVRVVLDLGAGEQEVERVDGTETPVYRCNECEAVSEDVCAERLYECNECGTKFLQSNGGGRNGNMCPECLNKFGTKVADQCCADCNEGEVEQYDGIACDCGQCFAVEDWWDHVKEDHLGR